MTGNRRSLRCRALLALSSLAAATLTGCSLSSTQPSTATVTMGGVPTEPAASASYSAAWASHDATLKAADDALRAKYGDYQLWQYPATVAQVDAQYVNLINHAGSEIDMEMYELADATIETALINAKKRNVLVHVLLDKDYTGGKVNQAAYKRLTDAGVGVAWAPEGTIFHIKTTVIDNDIALVSTQNLTSQYYPTGFDSTVMDLNPDQVQSIDGTFWDDWEHDGHGPPAAPGLVWSPDTNGKPAETALINEINSARVSIAFSSEEISDTYIVNALAAVAKRGVKVEVLMTASSEWAPEFATLKGSGVQIRTYANTESGLYVHEKMIAVDAGTPTESLLIGSQNATWTSLSNNRELALLLTDTSGTGAQAVIRQATTEYQTLFNQAQEN